MVVRLRLAQVLRLSMLVAAFVLFGAAPALATRSEVIAGSPSVKAVHAGGQTVITFRGGSGRRLYSQIVGREVKLSCRPAQLDPTSSPNSPDIDNFVPSRHSRKLRATLEGDWCEVLLVGKHHRVKPIVAVAITPAGVPFLDARMRAVVVDGLVASASLESEAGRYPATQDLLSHQRPGVIALASPSDPVPAGKYGFYSDGAQHVEAVGVTLTGKRLFEDVNGDVVSSNVLAYVRSLSFG
jgi:hypothetical protein